ncbi:MAG: phosphomannomutase/phosphoglucomutase [Vampirovibrionales bacterium]|nr:phosphomannomutase/phosphoglucomutase [Vampirovibrionales bacterium]
MLPDSCHRSSVASASEQTSFFCTYDIRGIVDDAFDVATFARLGMAFADWLAMHSGSSKKTTHEPLRVVVGHDARVHSPRLYRAFMSGLRARHVDVVELGLVPTTLVYFSEVASTDVALRRLLEQHGISTPQAVHGSITITASHNPKAYNGLKFTAGGHSLSSEQIQKLRDVFLKIPKLSDGSDAIASAENLLKTSCETFDAKAAYLAWISATFGSADPARRQITLVVDSGNGAAGVIAPQVFRAAGFNVISLFEEPDGTFPNHHPDPCVAANLVDLQHAVLEHRGDLGVAFDGDGDRMGLVDDTGAVIQGDRTLMLLAKEILNRLPKTPKPVIVSEVKCSQHLFDAIEQLGGHAVMSPTGHAIMKITMANMDAVLGGELSGHIFYRREHWGFDDGIYATLRVLMLLLSTKAADQKASISGLLAEFPTSAISQERRVSLPKAHHQAALEQVASLAQSLADCVGLPVRSVQTLDGIRVNLAGGFWLVRGSNTEPCLTLRCEAPDATRLERLQTWLDQQVDRIIHAVS